MPDAHGGGKIGAGGGDNPHVGGATDELVLLFKFLVADDGKNLWLEAHRQVADLFQQQGAAVTEGDRPDLGAGAEQFRFDGVDGFSVK